MSRSSRPRILHLHSTFDRGGKELRCVQLMNAFGPKAEHTIVSGEPGHLSAAELISPDVPALFPMDFPPLQGKPLPGRLRKLAERMKGYDLVLTYNWGAMDAVMAHTLFVQALGLPPLVHHEDGFNEDEAGGLKTRRNWYRRIAFGRTAALVVPSKRLEDIALNIWQQPRTRVHRISNGIKTGNYSRKPKSTALPSLVKHKGEYWLGTLAGLRKVKNLPRLVRALEGLPDEWQLVILGEGPEREAILAEAERLGLEHRVHLPGHVDRPADVIGLFDLFALSSDSEQSPVSVIEAMAAGLAVVAPAVGDIPDMVAPENRQFVTAPGDESAFADALLKLANFDLDRGAIGRANRARAREIFDEKRMIERYRALYGSLIGGNRL